MKFIFADSLDYVDPHFDFIADRSPAERQPYWDDAFPHEILGYAPYDGVLVSRGIVGGHSGGGKYSASQRRRFELAGVRKFLRLDTPEFSKLDIFGDCGAFTYAKEDKPPYQPSETAEFYDECGFTHGCSVDHIIFDFDPRKPGLSGPPKGAKERFDITLENADAFRRATQEIGASFTPMGVVQGWSPDSMAEAARRLISMGYDYLAVGGMVPLKSPEIKLCLQAIRAVVPASTRLHILGFAKANDIGSFHSLDIASFDTTSPLIRAFKDAKRNYYLPAGPDGLRYFTSIRVPQAIENNKLKRAVQMGTFKAEDLHIVSGFSGDVVVFDDIGTFEAISVADVLLAAGLKVTMVSRFEKIGEEVPFPPVTVGAARERLMAGNFDFIGGHCLRRIEQGAVHIGVPFTARERTLAADNVVMVGFKQPNRDLVEAIRSMDRTVHLIGDALGRNDLMSAIHGGADIGRSI